jgi:SAM-dependent methyltransferase
MITILRFFYYKFLHHGFDARKFLFSFISPSWFYRDLKKFKNQKGNDTTFKISNHYPIINDRKQQAGVMNGHYFHQDLYVARKIFESNPVKHLDIGSRTDGFVSHVASFRKIEIIDIRDIKSTVKNIHFRKADLMQLPEDLVDSFDSISSLHAIEHFGLGRYSDTIDYWGYLKAIENITRLLKHRGLFYFSVPIGPQRIEFNAHRVFSIDYLLSIFSKEYDLFSFSYINDIGDFYEDVKLIDQHVKNNYGCTYGCGIFILSKK